MKTKQTLFTLLAATVLSAGSASAMTFSSEDPEVQSVWSLFLPFLSGQTEAQKSAIQNQLINLVNEQSQTYDEVDNEDDFEDYDFATEKPEIIAELEAELSELEDGDLKKELAAELETLKSVTDEEAFWVAVDAAYAKVDAVYGYDDEDEYDVDFEEIDFATEKSMIIEGLNEEVSEVKDASIKSELSVQISTLESITDEEKFFETLDNVYEKIDNHFGYDEVDYKMTECGFDHEKEDNDYWGDKFEGFFDFDDEDEDSDDDQR